MPIYRQPGVYVEEMPGEARRIPAFGTSTAVFFGIAPSVDAPLRAPTFVSSFSQAMQVFCNGATVGSDLINALKGFFAMGGSRAYVVHLGPGAVAITQADLALIGDLENINLIAAPGFTDRASVDAILDDVDARADRFAVIDMADGGALQDMITPQATGGLRPRSSGFAAVYAPWLVARDAITGAEVAVPPSGHICGAYALTDAQHGVWKAPANIGLRGVVGVSRAVTEADQEVLNPAGINGLRAFPDGVRIWGARTLSADPDWRYVPVRRLVTMIERSILSGTSWTVFEPNDERLWASLRRDIGAFLHGLWRNGALQGAAPQDAYFVICDASTNPDTATDRVSVQVGVAPVKPAEFIILSIEAACAHAGPDQDAPQA